MSHFETIRAVIMNSSISGPDKMAMVEAFAEVNDEYLKDPAELISKEPSWIEKLNDNRKKKAEAFSAQNSEQWNSILKEEQKYLSDLAYNRD